MKDDIVSSVREEIETKMDEYFNEIIWKEKNYTVSLTKEYQVRVVGPRNDNKIGSPVCWRAAGIGFLVLSRAHECERIQCTTGY